MKFKLSVTAIALAVAFPALSADLVQFKSGDTASAEQVNANFAVNAAAAAAAATAAGTAQTTANDAVTAAGTAQTTANDAATAAGAAQTSADTAQLTADNAGMVAGNLEGSLNNVKKTADSASIRSRTNEESVDATVSLLNGIIDAVPALSSDPVIGLASAVNALNYTLEDQNGLSLGDPAIRDYASGMYTAVVNSGTLDGLIYRSSLTEEWVGSDADGLDVNKATFNARPLAAEQWGSLVYDDIYYADADCSGTPYINEALIYDAAYIEINYKDIVKLATAAGGDRVLAFTNFEGTVGYSIKSNAAAKSSNYSWQESNINSVSGADGTCTNVPGRWHEGEIKVIAMQEETLSDDAMFGIYSSKDFNNNTKNLLTVGDTYVLPVEVVAKPQP